MSSLIFEILNDDNLVIEDNYYGGRYYEFNKTEFKEMIEFIKKEKREWLENGTTPEK